MHLATPNKTKSLRKVFIILQPVRRDLNGDDGNDNPGSHRKATPIDGKGKHSYLFVCVCMCDKCFLQFSLPLCSTDNNNTPYVVVRYVTALRGSVHNPV